MFGRKFASATTMRCCVKCIIVDDRKDGKNERVGRFDSIVNYHNLTFTTWLAQKSIGE